jgi:ATP-dependent helicase/DNAse subunit B
MDDEELQIDDRIFGVVFHAASQYLYQEMMKQGHRIERQQIQQVLQSKVAVEMAVDKAFREQIPNKEYSGLQLINREVIIHYVRQLLKLDLQLAPFTIHALEYEVIHDWTVQQGDTSFTTTIGGSIDRLDAVVTDQQERIRVIDYKTGGGKLTYLPDVESIFATNESHNGYYLQTLLYSSIVREDATLNQEQLPVSPALLFIQHSTEEDYNPILRFGKEKITDVQPFIPAFREMLKTCIDEIFNPDKPFIPVEDQKTCRNCPYAPLCGRE